jgi:hypothetical protein
MRRQINLAMLSVNYSLVRKNGESYRGEGERSIIDAGWKWTD